jgi:hypothetical protein
MQKTPPRSFHQADKINILGKFSLTHLCFVR